MRKILLGLCFFLSSLMMNAQQIVDVVFDPASVNPAELPADMTIVDIEGIQYLRVVLDGYNSRIMLPELTLRGGQTMMGEFKYVVGPTTGTNNVQGVVQIEDSTNVMPAPWDPSTEIVAVTTLTQGTVTGTLDSMSSAVVPQMEYVHSIQFYGQNKDDGYSATVGDTMWVGRITVVKTIPETWITGIITRETFGDTNYGTGSGDNGKPKTTGDTLTGWKDNLFCTWRWDDITTFTSTNGHIESGSDSSIRCVSYTGGWTTPAEWQDPSKSVHALITNGSYNGSWDTLVLKDIDISQTVVQSIDFAYGKNGNWTFINADTMALNVQYSIDGGDWVQADTSVIDPFGSGEWRYISIPVDETGMTMDVMVMGLNQTQCFIDDLSLMGLVAPPQGINEFAIEKIVFGDVEGGASDFTGLLTASWDADSMYMTITIVDDTIVVEGTNIYEVDNIEVYFDMDNSKNIKWPRNGGWVANEPAYDANDYQFRLVPDSAFTADNPIAGAKVGYTINATGYEFVFNVAFDSLMEGFEGNDTAVIGFDILVSDVDEESSAAARNQITLNAPDDNPWNDPSQFATFAFMPDGRFLIIPDEEPPTRPANLVATDNHDGTVRLTWDASSDNIAVWQYIVRVDGAIASEQYALQTGNGYTITGLENGDEVTFGVDAVDNYGNVSPRASGNIVVDIAETAVELSTIEFSVRPNPASDVLNIVSTEAFEGATVISITGSVVMNITGSVNSIDVSSLNAGLYLIKFKAVNGSVHTVRFIKK